MQRSPAFPPGFTSYKLPEIERARFLRESQQPPLTLRTSSPQSPTSSSRDREPTRRGATLVAPATGVAAAGGPTLPHPTHYDGVWPVTSCRRGRSAGPGCGGAATACDNSPPTKSCPAGIGFAFSESGDSAAGPTARDDAGGAAPGTWARKRRRGCGRGVRSPQGGLICLPVLDRSVLSCPSVIVHRLPSGMALLQPSASRARLWRRNAGQGSHLSPVSGAGPERPAPAIPGALPRPLDASPLKPKEERAVGGMRRADRTRNRLLRGARWTSTGTLLSRRVPCLTLQFEVTKKGETDLAARRSRRLACVDRLDLHVPRRFPARSSAQPWTVSAT